jgi:hypothetical protein
MSSPYPNEPGIDPDKWEESPIPDRDNAEREIPDDDDDFEEDDDGEK